MAAPVAALAGQQAAGFAAHQAELAEEDPFRWAAGWLIKLGVGFILGGFGMGTLGYFLKASATAAQNQEVAVIQQLGATFSNIKAPSFVPAATGTAPITSDLKGIQDFFSDAWRDLQAAKSDLGQIGGVMGTLGEDLADGFIDAAKAMLGFTMHFPDILWNGLVWAVGGGTADLLNWLFPYLVIIGAVLLVLGVAAALIGQLWTRGVKPAYDRSSSRWLSRREAKVEGFFDRIFRNRPELPAPDASPTPPAAPAAGPAAPTGEPEGGGEAGVVRPIATPPGPATPDGPNPETGSPPASPPAPVEVHVTVDQPPAGVPTRAELEAHLGTVPNRAPTLDEMRQLIRESEENRRRSMPKTISGYDEMKKAEAAFAEAELAG